jgi:hypothetical protein
LLGFRVEAVAPTIGFFVCLVRFDDLARVRIAISHFLEKNALASSLAPAILGNHAGLSLRQLNQA